MLEYIKGYLKANDVEYKENYNLSKISHIRTGGKAKMLILPKNKPEFLHILDFLRTCQQDYTVVGGMSNILPCDKGYDGIIIKTDRISKLSIDGGGVYAECGKLFPSLSRTFIDAGLSGAERLAGIPGTLGGMIAGNAGAFGCEISHLAVSIEAYDKNSGDVVVIDASDADFSYRHSIFSDGGMIVLSAVLQLCEADSYDVYEETQRYRSRRRASQPYGLPSLGSIFKKPSADVFVGKMIEDLGLKGLTVGGAQISEKHAGFIVNIGGAVSADVVSLINTVLTVVYEKYGVMLELEIIPLGF
ncbi:MAG: UDP-N-acetylmuramate dehydrogenase [Clostridia bacterium]|nr:UDP-N-acetylmuramate dehydrogenase [Clostridia bacterium]